MSILVSNDVLDWLGKRECATATERAQIATLIPLAEGALEQYLGFVVEQATYTHYLPETDEGFDAAEGGLDVVNGRVVIEADNGLAMLVLPQRPVRSVTSVIEDQGSRGGQGSGDFGNASMTQGTDYYLDNTTSGVSWTGALMRVAGAWPTRRRTVKVVYVSGFTANELTAGTILGPDERSSIRNLKYAAIITAAAAVLEAQRHQSGLGAGPVIMERLADYQVQYAESYIKHMAMQSALPPKAMELVSGFRRLTL